MTRFRDCLKNIFVDPHLAFSIDDDVIIDNLSKTVLYLESTLQDLSIDWSHHYVSSMFKKYIL